MVVAVVLAVVLAVVMVVMLSVLLSADDAAAVYISGVPGVKGFGVFNDE